MSGFTEMTSGAPETTSGHAEISSGYGKTPSGFTEMTSGGAETMSGGVEMASRVTEMPSRHVKTTFCLGPAFSKDARWARRPAEKNHGGTRTRKVKTRASSLSFVGR